MIKNIVFTVIMALLLIFGCGKADPSVQASDINAYLSGSQDQQGEKLMETIARALDTQDAALLKSVFSEEAKKTCPELDSQIKDLFAYYKGPTVSFKGDTPYATGSTSLGRDKSGDLVGGQGWWLISGEYQVETVSEKYWLIFTFYSKHESAPEKNGIYILEIISNDLMETEGVYRHSMQTEKGIFIDQ